MSIRPSVLSLKFLYKIERRNRGLSDARSVDIYDNYFRDSTLGPGSQYMATHHFHRAWRSSHDLQMQKNL